MRRASLSHYFGFLYFCSSKGAIDLIAYAAEHADTKTPSKDEMRRRIEAEKDGKVSAVKFSRETDAEFQAKVNSAMTMAEAKRMLESTFKVCGIGRFGEYKNAEEWLRDVGSEDVELNIDSEYSLYQKYIGGNEDILNEEYSIADVLDAYLAGTLVGKEKPKAKRMDTSKSYGLSDDRFYAPKKIEDAKKFLDLANQKLTNANRTAVNTARAKVLLFAHNKGAAELLGMTQAELNKKLRGWSAYSARAKSISEAANKGVAEENRWTGIENCSYINKTAVTDEEIDRLVGDIKGRPNSYEKRYIARVMLAADTHISYKGLNFVFESKRNVNARIGNPKGSTNGFYSPGNGKAPDTIVCSYDKPETVAHEMGHYIDTRWGRDLIGADSGALYLTKGVNMDMIRARHGEDGIQFANNFKIFINSLMDVNTAISSYTNDQAEVFARFFAKFVEWTDNIATGSKAYSYESNVYGDKFTQSQYVEFIKLLQEKSMLDAKYEASQGKKKFSRETYWKPNLNKAEWSLLNDRTAVEIASKSKFLDEATKWLYAKRKDTEVFAIYGIGDGTVPTVLYASGGKKATSDLAQFTSFLKEYDYGTVTYAKTAVRWAEIVSSIKRSMYGDYDADGHRRKTLELDGILAEASKRLRKGDSDASAENSGGVSYSREPETLNELRRQNRMLRERVEYWKGQTKPAKEKTLNKNDVHKLAMRLKEIEPTDLKTSEIEIRLNQLGRYILNTKELRFTDVAEMAEDLAWDIVDNMSVKTEAPELELHNDIKSTQLALEDVNMLLNNVSLSYQELSGNYNRHDKRTTLPNIIPYQELSGNYNLLFCCRSCVTRSAFDIFPVCSQPIFEQKGAAAAAP